MLSFASTVTSPVRILVVDDDAAIRQAIAELLAEEGFEVSCAANGAEALRELESTTVPSLILLDLTMPVMDGWTFRSAQRQDPRLAGIPTIVLTAIHGGDPRVFEPLAADAFLPKPFDLERLIATVHRLSAET